MTSLSAHNDDNDSDFGYDFTPEDEQLLLQLGSDLTPGQASLDVANAVDTVPGKTAITTRPGPEDSYLLDIRAQSCFDDSGNGALPPEVGSEETLSPLTLGTDMLSPTRRYSLALYDF